MRFYKSGDLLRLLGVSYWRLDYLFRSRKICEFMRDSSGDRIFSERDVQSIKKVLKGKKHHSPNHSYKIKEKYGVYV